MGGVVSLQANASHLGKHSQTGEIRGHLACSRRTRRSLGDDAFYSTKLTNRL